MSVCLSKYTNKSLFTIRYFHTLLQFMVLAAIVALNLKEKTIVFWQLMIAICAEACHQ